MSNRSRLGVFFAGLCAFTLTVTGPSLVDAAEAGTEAEAVEALPVLGTAIDFTLTSSDQADYSLEDAIDEKRLVLIFFRGAW